MLAAVLLLVWIASFVVPAGAYKTDSATGAPVPGTYHKLQSCSAPAATAPAIDAESPTESGQAPADAESAPGATITAAEAGLPCVDTSFSFRFKQLWGAPPNGLYGVESAKGFVGPWEEGFLYGSAAIFLFVLAVGAFITVTMKSEAIQTGIGTSRAAVPREWPRPDRDPDGGLRARGHVVRDVGGDPGLLRAPRPAFASRSATTAWSRPRSSSSAPEAA